MAKHSEAKPKGTKEGNHYQNPERVVAIPVTVIAADL